MTGANMPRCLQRGALFDYLVLDILLPNLRDHSSTTFSDAFISISISDIVPRDFNRSTSSRKISVTAYSNLFFSANFKARLFSSFFEEYRFGSSPSTKLNTKPHLVCPIVGVDGLTFVSI